MVSDTSRNGGAVMIGLNRRRTMGNVSPLLPREYQQLEYISTNASTYYKTGYIPTANCKIEVTFKGVTTTLSKAGVLFGCRNDYNNNSIYYRTSASSASAITTNFELAWNTVRTISKIAVNASDKITYKLDKGTFYYNDTILASYSDTPSPSYELCLFAINNAGSRLNVDGAVGYFYGARIEDNGGLVRNYIPVKRVSDNVKGIYDLVNSTFTQISS